MPAPPKPKSRVIVNHAADHVFGWVDTVHECPEAEEAPWDQQLHFPKIKERKERQKKTAHLQPNNYQIPKPNHRNLGGGISNPGFGVLDGDDVHEVEDEFHSEEAREETEEVDDDGAGTDGEGAVVLFFVCQFRVYA